MLINSSLTRGDLMAKIHKENGKTFNLWLEGKFGYFIIAQPSIAYTVNYDYSNLMAAGK
jgi:hypothetical protein